MPTKSPYVRMPNTDFKGYCSCCKADIEAGEVRWWHVFGKRIACQACVDKHDQKASKSGALTEAQIQAIVDRRIEQRVEECVAEQLKLQRRQYNQNMEDDISMLRTLVSRLEAQVKELRADAKVTAK